MSTRIAAASGVAFALMVGACNVLTGASSLEKTSCVADCGSDPAVDASANDEVADAFVNEVAPDLHVDVVDVEDVPDVVDVVDAPDMSTEDGGPLLCTDGRQNGTETDIDCGGLCRPCAFSKKCAKDSDCALRACSNPDSGPRTCECPSDMVAIGAPVDDAGVPNVYCIDRTEVSNAEYAAFLGLGTTTDVPSCKATKTRGEKPKSDWPRADRPNHPVRYVDWCDAVYFCQSKGKRLCARIGGTPCDVKDATSQSCEWMRACSKNDSSRIFPYGSTFNASACNTQEFSLKDTADVGSFAGCTGGYPGLVDMVGNVMEWEGACKGGDAGSYECLARGGSYDTPPNARCSTATPVSRFNVENLPIGIRCCGG